MRRASISLATLLLLTACESGGGGSDMAAPPSTGAGGKADTLTSGGEGSGDGADAGTGDAGDGAADSGTCVDPPVRPPLVQLVNNSLAPTDPIPEPLPLADPVALSAAEIDDALAELADAVQFAAYPFSGCHDRAHLTALHLSALVGAQHVAKVWVFGPNLLTVAVPGGVTAEVDPTRWGVDTTLWDYHVAALIAGPDGFIVIDPVLADAGTALTLDEWFAEMQYAPGSAYTIASASNYSFNTIESVTFGGARLPFNGSMFGYDGFARSDMWLEKNLARDAVAVALSNAPTECETLQADLLDPQALYDALESLAAGSAPADCVGFVDQYTTEIASRRAELIALGG